MMKSTVRTIEHVMSGINNTEVVKGLKEKLPAKTRTQFSMVKHMIKMSKRIAYDNYSPLILGKTWFCDKEVTLMSNEMALFTSIGHLPGAAVMPLPGDEYVIFVNEGWENAPQPMKEAIIAHELGHIKHNHVSSIEQGLLYNAKRMVGSKDVTKSEIEADMVAVENGHGEALLQFLEDLKEQGIDSKELKTRRQAIRRSL